MSEHIRWMTFNGAQVSHGCVWDQDANGWRTACRPKAIYAATHPTSPIMKPECSRCRATFNAFPEMESPDDYELKDRI